MEWHSPITPDETGIIARALLVDGARFVATVEGLADLRGEEQDDEFCREWRVLHRITRTWKQYPWDLTSRLRDFAHARRRPLLQILSVFSRGS